MSEIFSIWIIIGEQKMNVRNIFYLNNYWRIKAYFSNYVCQNILKECNIFFFFFFLYSSPLLFLQLTGKWSIWMVNDLIQSMSHVFSLLFTTRFFLPKIPALSWGFLFIPVFLPNMVMLCTNVKFINQAIFIQSFFKKRLCCEKKKSFSPKKHEIKKNPIKLQNVIPCSTLFLVP